MLQARLGRTDGSVDLLITGCEVSLWLGEQFAADVHLAFPRLKVVTISNPYPDPNPHPDPNPNQVVTISANKLLGQLGQQFPVPQAGFLLRASYRVAAWMHRVAAWMHMVAACPAYGCRRASSSTARATPSARASCCC